MAGIREQLQSIITDQYLIIIQQIATAIATATATAIASTPVIAIASTATATAIATAALELFVTKNQMEYMGHKEGRAIMAIH